MTAEQARRERLWFWGVLLALAALRLPFVAGELFIGDALELAGAAARLGVAHPPGYPGLLVVAHLRQAACGLTGLNPGAAFNTLALIFSLAGAAFFFKTLRSLKLEAPLAALGAFGLTLGPLLTSQALTFEVHALQHLLLALSLYAAVGVLNDDGDGRRTVLLGLALGLLLTNHLSALVLAPFFAYTAWRGLRARKPGRRLLAAALFLVGLLLGLSAYLYLPLRAGAAPAYDFGMVGNAPNLWAHLTGKTYTLRPAGELFDPRVLAAAGELLLDAFPWPLWLLAPLGAVALKHRYGWGVLWLWTALPLSVVLLGLYDIVDPQDYLTPLVFVAGLTLALGAGELAERWAEARLRRRLAWSAGLALLLLWGLNSGLRAERPAAGELQAAASRDELRDLPPEARSFAVGDDLLFGPLYLHTVEDRRPDVDVLDWNGNLNRGDLGPRFALLPPPQRRRWLEERASVWLSRGRPTRWSLYQTGPDDLLDPYVRAGLHLALPEDPSVTDGVFEILETRNINPTGLPQSEPYLANGMGFRERLRFQQARQLLLEALAVAELDPLDPRGPLLLRRAAEINPDGLNRCLLQSNVATLNAYRALAALQTGASGERLELLLPARLATWGQTPPIREHAAEHPVAAAYLVAALDALREGLLLDDGPRYLLTAARNLLQLGYPTAAASLIEHVDTNDPALSAAATDLRARLQSLAPPADAD
jgi:hypothetical protein